MITVLPFKDTYKNNKVVVTRVSGRGTCDHKMTTEALWEWYGSISCNITETHDRELLSNSVRSLLGSPSGDIIERINFSLMYCSLS